MSFKVLKIAPFMATMMLCAAAAMPSFGAKPYDAEVEYLDAGTTSGKTMYINTGLQPANNMGALVRFMPKQNSADSVMFGSKSSNDKNWYFGGSAKYYLAWNSNPAANTRPTLSPNSIYDVSFNYLNDRNRRIVGVGNDTDYSLAINEAWAGSGTLYPIWLFTFNNKGSPYGNGGYYRIYSARFTQNDGIVMDLIPVRKDGVGYMFDKVTGTLLTNTKPSGAPDFVYGNDVADESYIEGTIMLTADANWTSRGILHLDSTAVIDLNGHSLTIDGAFGNGTITDSSGGATLRLPDGAPFSATTSGSLTVLRSDKPYDAQVEYLEAPSNNKGKVPYIDTGLYPGDNKGAHVRIMPLRKNTDSTVCGVQSHYSGRDYFKWYFGCAASTVGVYLAWDTATPDAKTWPAYDTGKRYDIYFNYLNDRNRSFTGVDDETNYSLALEKTWPSAAATNTIHLYGYNNNGTAANTGNVRIYSAQFTQGGNVVMDLIPVRKNGVGYMYDKVSEKLLAKVPTAPLAFTYENDAADEAYIEGNITLDADADWTSRGILRIDSSATIDLNGHSLTIAGAYGSGTITNSSATLGEVHFDITARMQHTSDIRLLGNLKVFKEGGGTLSLIRAGQTFTGGVVVSAGVAMAIVSENNHCWGPDDGTITVMPGATFDTKGNTKFANKQFELAGGTLANSGADMSSFDDGICHIRLTADSYMDAQSSIHLWAQDGVSNPYMDLGGHKLTMTIASGKVLYINMINNTLTNGTIEVLGDGGWFRSSSKSGLTAFGGSDTLNLRIFGCPLRMQRGFVVHDYYAGYVGTAASESEPLQVHGTFTPAAVDGIGQEYFYGCEMQDGSCIDLSAKSNTWDTTSTGFTSGSRTVTFVEGATVAIDVHGRTLAKGEQVVSWNSRPSNVTFTWDAATTALGKQMFVTDEGIYYDIAEMDVATACWTGAANDNNVTNPANWACTNYVNAEVLGGLPLGSSEVHVSGDIAFDITAEKPLAYNTLSFDSVRLTGDCDWSGLAAIAKLEDDGDIMNLGTVNLNGHKLRLAAPQIPSTLYDCISLLIGDSSGGVPGELHIDVPLAETKLICTGLALSDNTKLVKDGPGDLAMTRANQTFTGGVLIAEGKGYLPSQNFSETNLFWGAAGGTITVVTNATFDVNGNNDFYLKNFVLDGGTLACSVNMNIGTGKYGFGNVTLVADSHFNMRNATFLNPLDPATKVDLGGHALEVELGDKSGANLHMPVPVENGNMSIVSGGYLALNAGTVGGSSSLNLEMSGATFKTDGDFSVSNYVARYTDKYNHGSAAIKVYGTFTPDALSGGKEYFHGCAMQDGSCIDLSRKTAIWNNVATGWGIGYESGDGNRTVTFADNATVTIDVHGRELTKGDLIVEWGVVPANLSTLTFVSDAVTDKPLLATEVGIYYDIASNEAATAYWTGAIDNDVTKPGNWACTNFFGGEVANGLPVVATKVYVSGDIALDITAEKKFAFESLTFSNARLSGDCDWSGLEWALTANGGDTVNLGSIDLNGHKLRLATPSSASTFYDCISLAVTDGSEGNAGELHLEVPSASAKLICTGLALSGNVKLVKDGTGWLAMTRANQTFTGGVLIAAGKGYLTGQSFPETNSYWGANDGTITVVTNATFDVCGNNGFYAKNFVLDGGTLDCSANMNMDAGNYGIGNVTLVADSFFAMSVAYKTAIFSSPTGTAKIDLGGHALVINLNTGSQMHIPVPVENGTLNVVYGGYLYLDSGTSGGSSSVNLDMLRAAFWTDGDLSVSNYVARYTQRWNHGAQPLLVYGTFTPAAVDASGKEYFHGCVMQDGSSIDLSGKSNAWSVVSTGWPVPGYEGDADGSRMVTFVDNAKVGILLGTRKLRSEEKIIDWSGAVPENRDGLEFFGQFSDGRRTKLKVKDDGLYALKKGMTIIVK